MSDTLSSLQPSEVQIDNFLLKRTFLEHLNYIYTGKHNLLKFFKEVKEIAKLNVLKMAIQEGIDDTLDQIAQMDEIYTSIDESPSKTKTLGLSALSLEAYLTVIKGGKTPLERDVFILFYLQQIEGIEMTYYNVLKNLARAIGYKYKYLDKPLDTAAENKILFESIYREYIN
jgi:ferritin-like metal-binding protein YciE